MEARWVLQLTDFEKYKADRLNRPSARQIRQYYDGIKTRKKQVEDKYMYEDELKDLEGVD